MAGMDARPHIALNAHLLSGEASYRSAGIHGYLFNTLTHLPQVAPDMAFTALVGNSQSELLGRTQSVLQAYLSKSAPAFTVQRSRWGTRNPAARIAWEQIALPGVLKRLQPDLFHGMAFALPLRWQGPSVITIFDLSFLRYPERLSAARRLYLRRVTAASAERARRVIAISESGRQEISELLGVPQAKIDVALPGVGRDFAPLNPDDVAAFRARPDVPEHFILYLGTLEPRKNLPTLLEAYARLPQRGDVKLVLAGGRGWQTGPIFALIESLGLAADVVLPGYIPADELPMWYNAATLFAYPSVYEGFGIPLIEAMACGTPVVAADTTSLPEAAGPAGVLVPPTDVTAWADALGGLLDDPGSRRLMAAEGWRHAQRFTWAETARQVAASYRRALGGGGEASV